MTRRGRPKLDVSKKREAILTAAAELFRTFGFNKVSVDEVCKEARSSKMTFYRQFKDKADLSLCLIEKYNLEAKESVLGILALKSPFSEKLKALMQLNSEYQEKIGLRFIEDLVCTNDPRMSAGIRNITQKMEDLNFKFIETGKKGRIL